MNYSPEYKESILRRMLPPNNESISKIAKEEGLSETELAKYARKKGLYVEQIKAWRDACMNVNGGAAKEAARLSRELKESQRERKKLEREIQRKEKALAEAAALLVLSKKANAIWGDPEDEK